MSRTLHLISEPWVDECSRCYEKNKKYNKNNRGVLNNIKGIIVYLW